MAGNQELVDLALSAARAAAELVRERARGHVTVAATKSSDVDVVTEADRASEALIREHIRSARPEDGFLGEEGDDVASSTGVRWIVDPIDGTVNFLYGIPQYAVSIAAELDGEVVAGVVLDVQAGTEYVGRLADASGPESATRDGVPVAVRGPAPMAQRLIATGFSYDRRVRVLQAEAVTRLLPLVRDVRRLGSCALDLCLVADGRLDGYVEEGVNLWDHAAAGLIARIAGARTHVLPGIGGLDLLVCGPAHGFDELLTVVTSTGFSPETGE
ncbi:inositol monophosphatase [Nocardioides sp. Root1257]|uniref:inositol monophosphatase family protein n=1 Tax=unclassified Nocardioides TaxID=2615069 RepID=UPI0006FA96A1|nr:MULTISPECIES: inositol monophosphatase family protein [unclassified Nocardioides]KQW53203.1 inositol monophosphatase [Nocardioides sp. Root1257]KRC55890.1 inositol monophosphatase [Nocardioides sp. Root224]